MKALSDILRGLEICSASKGCIGCPYDKNFPSHDRCIDSCMRDAYEFLDRFTWIGKHIWIVVYDPENEFSLVEENVINEVGVNHFWCSEFSPPMADIGSVFLISDVGNTVFFDRRSADRRLAELIAERRSYEF